MTSPSVNPEFFTLIENSFQDLVSNAGILTAKPTQTSSEDKLNEGDWEFIADKLGVKRFKRVQTSNPNILTIGGVGIIDTPPKVITTVMYFRRGYIIEILGTLIIENNQLFFDSPIIE